MNKRILIIAAAFAIVMTSFVTINKDVFNVNITESTLKWTGYHLAKSYEHNGNIKLKSGSVDVVDGKITGGTFIIDMNSITNNDLEGSKNTKLVNHLKSDDFFNTEKFPEAKLVINKIENNVAEAQVTIRNITEPISFNINIEESTDDKIVASAKFNIDRTKHEVAYGWSVDNAMLSNEFQIEVKIVATK